MSNSPTHLLRKVSTVSSVLLDNVEPLSAGTSSADLFNSCKSCISNNSNKIIDVKNNDNANIQINSKNSSRVTIKDFNFARPPDVIEYNSDLGERKKDMPNILGSEIVRDLISRQSDIGIQKFNLCIDLIKHKSNKKSNFKTLSYISDRLLNDLNFKDKYQKRLSDGKSIIFNDKILLQNNWQNSINCSTTTDTSLYQNFELLIHYSNKLNKQSFTYDNSLLPLLLKKEYINSSFSVNTLKQSKRQVFLKTQLIELENQILMDKLNELDNLLQYLNSKKHKIVKKINYLDNEKQLTNNLTKNINERIDFLQEYNLYKENSENKLDIELIANEKDKITISNDDSSIITSTTSINMRDNDEYLQRNKDDYIIRNIHCDNKNFNIHYDNLLNYNVPSIRKYYASGSKLGTLENYNDSNSISCLDFDIPFGKLYSTNKLDNSIKVWDLNRFKQIGIKHKAHLTTINCIQLYSTKDLLITGGKDALVKLWDIQSEKFCEDEEENSIEPLNEDSISLKSLFDLHSDEITSLFMHENNLVTGSQDKTIIHWDLNSGKNIQSLLIGFPMENQTVNYIDHNRKNNFRVENKPIIGALQCFDSALATGTKDGIIRLWDLRSGEIARKLIGHQDAITSLKFDTNNIISGSLDGSTRIWDLRQDQLIDLFKYDLPIKSLDFDDKNIVINTFGNSRINVYNKLTHEHSDHCNILEDNHSVEYLRYKDGYLIEGRNDGKINSWVI
ncbi:hypothetical protein TBLA_0H03060 [Henningerozyma blattae CBS 6284]|uniref:Uncharacterized protein n=1 Tax=Henningerozyma blattae (strain ATCC 34711 / CBS 6284 / DSM 70876 / NBRC 10599 / NRRL Y-10934 / UCD 77-7) TaxID=1071380 RepID=I2H885_HENB6|nr:hypothetical protein TBLA_0H03060 [Tetrapisispora blattae CBS 6284]CCH62587.1 hypothetical protein TBLA_0H03060 [Tetrapisispora blattae CBS 6284]